MTPKIIAVLGATGNQGGSVASTFLADPAWQVRAVTRNAAGAKAQALKERGAEVVEADMDSPESLRRAFAGAHAVYAVSDPIGLLQAGPEKSSVKPLPGQNLVAWATGCELQQLKNAIDAAAEASTLERFVISALPNVTQLSGGKYKQVYQFESKALAVEYTKEKHPELWSKTSVYLAGWFLSNLLPGGLAMPQKTEEGVLQFTVGIKAETIVPVFAAEEDSGLIVQALVREPTAGKRVLGQRASMTLTEFLALFSKTTGRKVEYVAGPTDESQIPLPPFMQGPIAEMNWYWDDFGYTGGDKSVILPDELTFPPSFETVAEYLQKHSWE